MIAYAWAQNPGQRPDRLLLHRVEGEAIDTDDPERDRRHDIKKTVWARCCDGSKVGAKNNVQPDIAKAPQTLTACPKCFAGRVDELVPLYRKIPMLMQFEPKEGDE